MTKNALTKSQSMKRMLDSASVKQQFDNALKENSGIFIASLIDLYTTDNKLGACNPGDVIHEALKAATLKLPINKQLGFAYVVPYKNRPTFQIGYKGYIQLAMRTGQYRFLNCDVVKEGMMKSHNYLTGEIDLSGKPTSDKIVGYFAYMELLNGFVKIVYMTTKEVKAHGKRYSPSFSYKTSAWQTNFDDMALKTVLRKLLSKFGIMSVEMATGMASETNYESDVFEEIQKNANSKNIDTDTGEVIEVESVDVEVAEEEVKLKAPIKKDQTISAKNRKKQAPPF